MVSESEKALLFRKYKSSRFLSKLLQDFRKPLTEGLTYLSSQHWTPSAIYFFQWNATQKRTHWFSKRQRTLCAVIVRIGRNSQYCITAAFCSYIRLLLHQPLNLWQIGSWCISLGTLTFILVFPIAFFTVRAGLG